MGRQALRAKRRDGDAQTDARGARKNAFARPARCEKLASGHASTFDERAFQERSENARERLAPREIDVPILEREPSSIDGNDEAARERDVFGEGHDSRPSNACAASEAGYTRLVVEDDAVDPVSLPEPGTLLRGRYRVERVVGLGAMGAVIAAHHEELGERVALKLLLRTHHDDSNVRLRFKREARAAFKLKSEHACRVLDAGELDDGTPFIAMEFLHGETLAQVQKARTRLPVGEAVDLVLQAIEALADAHDHGIVHRDLKPANFVLTRRHDGSPCVKVIDFGVAKLAPHLAPEGEVTNTFGFVGSSVYAAPEQLGAARDATPRADIWSLGVVLYQLVSGRLPFVFSSSSPAVVLSTVTRTAPLPLTEAPQLEPIIQRCLAHDPEKRFASVRELADALRGKEPVLDATRVEPLVVRARPSGTGWAIAAGVILAAVILVSGLVGREALRARSRAAPTNATHP
jgi:eukaryotic-like serine/threonine-protein kinase